MMTIQAKALWFVCWPLLRLPRNLFAGAASVLDAAWNALAAAGWLGEAAVNHSAGSAEAERQKAVLAGRELGDVAWMAVNDTPDILELAAYFKESSEAMRAMAKVELADSRKPEILLNVAEGFLNSMNAKLASTARGK